MKQIIVLLSALAIMGAGCNAKNIAYKVVNQPKQETEQVIVEKGDVPSAVLEKYKEKRLDVLHLNKATTTKDVCSSMTDTVNLILKSVEIKPDYSWVVIVQKSGSRVTVDPSNSKKIFQKLQTETWTMSSSDVYDAHDLFGQKEGRVDSKGGSGFGKMPIGSDILRPVYVSPQKVIFERYRGGC